MRVYQYLLLRSFLWKDKKDLLPTSSYFQRTEEKLLKKSLASLEKQAATAATPSALNYTVSASKKEIFAEIATVLDVKMWKGIYRENENSLKFKRKILRHFPDNSQEIHSQEKLFLKDAIVKNRIA